MNCAAVQLGSHMPTQLPQPCNASFKQPLHNSKASAAINRTGMPAGNTANTEQPAKTAWQHDPDAPGAIILNQQQWSEAIAKDSSSTQAAPVVIDPFIAKKLRPHQSQGVRFLYECIMGLREANR